MGGGGKNGRWWQKMCGRGWGAWVLANMWLVVHTLFNNLFTYLLMTTDGEHTICGHRLRVWWGVKERRATPNACIFNRSRDVPRRLTKIQNSLCGVISCLLIKIYSTIISSLAFSCLCPVSVHRKVHWKVRWTNCPVRQPPNNHRKII